MNPTGGVAQALTANRTPATGHSHLNLRMTSSLSIPFSCPNRDVTLRDWLPPNPSKTLKEF
jgi:hypothetical protein